jgi:hypothetical protein
MKAGFFQRIRGAFRRDTSLHPIDRQMARRWIKQRLVVVFPELRNNPRALEAAYRALNLDPRPGQEEGEAETVFEMTIPDEATLRER